VLQWKYLNSHNYHNSCDAYAGFTLVEAVVAISVLGIGAASTIGALTKFNSFAAMSRNATGAYTVVMNQIDLFESMSPFNPQKTNQDPDPCTGQLNTAQIPKDTCNNPPTYDMTVGTHTIGYKDPITGVVSNQWPVYQYKDPSTGTTVVVQGTLTTTVTDISTTSMPNTYMAVVTITYSYLNHDGVHQPKYSFSMTAIRTSDI
jgi:type II secretory pathway pseudopilin PulG